MQENEIGNKIIEIIANDSTDYYEAFWRIYELKESNKFKDKVLDIPVSKNKETKILFTHILDAISNICNSEKLPIPIDYPSMNLEYFEDFDLYYGGLIYEEIAFLFIAPMSNHSFVLQTIHFESNTTKYQKFSLSNLK